MISFFDTCALLNALKVDARIILLFFSFSCSSLVNTVISVLLVVHHVHDPVFVLCPCS